LLYFTLHSYLPKIFSDSAWKGVVIKFGNFGESSTLVSSITLCEIFCNPWFHLFWNLLMASFRTS